MRKAALLGEPRGRAKMAGWEKGQIPDSSRAMRNSIILSFSYG